MNAVEVNDYVIEEMGLAEENGEDVTIRLYLSNEDTLEIWFDKGNDCYMWSDASFGYEDTYAIVYDIFNWLEENSLFIAGAETIWAFIITNLLIK